MVVRPISPYTSPLCFPYVSLYLPISRKPGMVVRPVSPFISPYLPHISPISPTSPPYLPHISPDQVHPTEGTVNPLDAPMDFSNPNPKFALGSLPGSLGNMGGAAARALQARGQG